MPEKSIRKRVDFVYSLVLFLFLFSIYLKCVIIHKINIYIHAYYIYFYTHTNTQTTKQQHIMPSIQEATVSIDRLQPLHILEKLLSLCVPVTYLWLLMFYLIFHLFLNLLAEILRFGDRVIEEMIKKEEKYIYIYIHIKGVGVKSLKLSFFGFIVFVWVGGEAGIISHVYML
jgi:hypothetical protein